VRVGADLPSSGVTYYEVPREYGVTNYRYTIVNDRTVLVDPGSHRIVIEPLEWRAANGLRKGRRSFPAAFSWSVLAGVDYHAGATTLRKSVV
jgi:hypothetical protein